LIDDLLLYSHVNRGLSVIEMVNLNEVLRFVLDDLELQIEQKAATVQVGPLPTINGRARQLQQLFENLIGNALKYSKEDVPPVVQITCVLSKGSKTGIPAAVLDGDRTYHLIAVRDNGIGFAQEDAERIFTVFTRLHGNTEYRGTGVGLSIVQKVVQNHGGYIWAESTPGKGATFKILLPVE
jgi:signal transduction histidine kinase